MKNSFTTLSSILDEKKEKQERQAKEQRELKEKQDKEFKTEILRQFDAAKKIIGHRLTIKKQNSNMYYFHFEGIDRWHVAYIISMRSSLQALLSFSLQESSSYGEDNVNSIVVLQKSLYLPGLKDRLVDWCKFIIKVCYSDKED